MVFAKRGCKFLYNVERNGAKLQEVCHKDAHAMRVYELSKTFFQKFILFMRLFLAPRLHDAELKARISENAEIFKQLSLFRISAIQVNSRDGIEASRLKFSLLKCFSVYILFK
jgi:hypothetical protein